MLQESTRRFRMTRQRDVILRVLRNLQSHPTADELYHAVRKQVPRISLGTVYRNLDVLCEQGLACRLEIGGGQRRYDAGMCPHLHGRCVRCDNVIDLPAETAPPVEIKLPDDLGFQLTEYRLELFGICRSCQEEAAHAENKNRRRLSTN